MEAAIFTGQPLEFNKQHFSNGYWPSQGSEAPRTQRSPKGKNLGCFLGDLRVFRGGEVWLP
jgi:hypothetical protein